MKKTPLTTARSTEDPGTPLPYEDMRGEAGRGSRAIAVGLTLLIVLLAIGAWAGLTGRLQRGPATATTGLTIVPTTAAAAISQIEPPRRDSAMAYDPVHRTVLLFGGTLMTSDGSLTNETWSWDGQTWRQLHPTTSPPAQQGTMVYDAASQQIVLFLSQTQSGNNATSELWTWNGSNWQKDQSNASPAVIGASLAYDAARHDIVLFGGAAVSGHTTAPTNATWTWNGRSWQEQHPANAPSARVGAVMAYDAARQQVVLYGGLTGQGLSSEIWTWNGQTWQMHQVSDGPSVRQKALFVYDDATQQVILFGGLNADGTSSTSDDTWSWSGNAWTRVSEHGAPTNLYEAATYDEATHTIVVYTVQGTVNKLNTPGSPAPVSQTWNWNGQTWKKLS